MITGGAVNLDDGEQELIRSLILANPDLVLNDDQVMRVLIGSQAQGARNVVDLRDRLVERMEGRLQKLMRTNRSVVAAAYENVATTNQIHRAILALIDAEHMSTFLRRLVHDLPLMVGVEEARLCLEANVSEARAADELAPGLDGRVVILPEGTISDYLHLEPGEPLRVTLRQCPGEKEIVFGHLSPSQSEALLPMELSGVKGLLAFGAADPERFSPDQGTDLLAFAGEVAQRLLVRHLGTDPKI